MNLCRCSKRWNWLRVATQSRCGQSVDVTFIYYVNSQQSGQLQQTRVIGHPFIHSCTVAYWINLLDLQTYSLSSSVEGRFDGKRSCKQLLSWQTLSKKVLLTFDLRSLSDSKSDRYSRDEYVIPKLTSPLILLRAHFWVDSNLSDWEVGSLWFQTTQAYSSTGLTVVM